MQLQAVQSATKFKFKLKAKVKRKYLKTFQVTRLSLSFWGVSRCCQRALLRSGSRSSARCRGEGLQVRTDSCWIFPARITTLTWPPSPIFHEHSSLARLSTLESYGLLSEAISWFHTRVTLLSVFARQWMLRALQILDGSLYQSERERERKRDREGEAKAEPLSLCPFSKLLMKVLRRPLTGIPLFISIL